MTHRLNGRFAALPCPVSKRALSHYSTHAGEGARCALRQAAACALAHCRARPGVPWGALTEGRHPMNLGEFIDTFKEAIARRVVESYPPLYRPSENGGRLPGLLRTPLGAQADAIRGAALSLEAHRGTNVVGEMGTGKTFMAPRRLTWRASGGCWCSARPTWCASGSGRWRRRCPTRGPPSSPPSPTWSGCASPRARGPSSPSCPGSGPSSPTDGSPR